MYRVPKKRANIGLVPRVLAKQGGDKERGGEGGEEGEGGRGGEKGGEGEGGKGGEEGGGGEVEGMDTAPQKSAPKMSNDDFRNLLKK